jgi:hypothetical protein
MSRPELAEYEARFADWIRGRLRIFAAVLVPLVIAVPLRALWFPDSTVPTIVLLGPVTEESVKMAGTVAALLVLAMGLPPMIHRVSALRSRLFWVPWVVGGAYGAYEALANLGRDAPFVSIFRVADHAAFTALGFTTALVLWKWGARPIEGAVAGLGLSILVHDVFNAFAVFARFTVTGFVEQAAYGAGVVTLALVLSFRVTRREPGSYVGAEFILPFTGRERA